MRKDFLLAVVLLMTPAAVSAQEAVLPTTGFVSGRAATQEDVKAGNAVFVLTSKDTATISRPLQIEIPQFALLSSKPPEKMPTLVVVVQGEEFSDGKLLGVRELNGKEHVVMLSDVTLLGKKAP